MTASIQGQSSNLHIKNYLSSPISYMKGLKNEQMNLAKKIMLYVFCAVFLPLSLLTAAVHKLLNCRVKPIPTPVPTPVLNKDSLIDGVSVPESLINGRSFLNKYLGGVYLLNCPGSVPRFQGADEELRKIGSPTYMRFNAYMGKKLDENPYELRTKSGAVHKLDYAHFRTRIDPGVVRFAGGLPNVNVETFIKGTAGCYMSHLEIVKDAKAKGLKNIVIFEDDVSIRDPKGFSTHLKAIFEKGLPADTGVCFLFYGRDSIKLEDLPKNHALHDKIAKVYKYSCGQAAYIITEKAYDALIDSWSAAIEPNSKIWYPSDMAIKRIIGQSAASRPFETYALKKEVRDCITVRGESEIAAM